MQTEKRRTRKTSAPRTLTEKDVGQPRGGVPVKTGLRGGAAGKLKGK